MGCCLQRGVQTRTDGRPVACRTADAAADGIRARGTADLNLNPAASTRSVAAATTPEPTDRYHRWWELPAAAVPAGAPSSGPASCTPGSPAAPTTRWRNRLPAQTGFAEPREPACAVRNPAA